MARRLFSGWVTLGALTFVTQSIVSCGSEFQSATPSPGSAGHSATEAGSENDGPDGGAAPSQGGAENGAAGGGGSATTHAGESSSGGMPPIIAEPCDETAQPVAAAIFVSPNGSDSNAGTAQLPVKTIATALAKAKANFAERIYLQVGDYVEPETIVLSEAESGIIIEGGWSKQGASWSPACEDDRRLLTTISVESAVAVRVADLAGAGGLRHLTLATKSAGTSVMGEAGESLFGVWVSGANTAFNLLDVEVRAGAAGAGGAAKPPPAAPGTATCTGHTACCTSGAGCGDPAGPVPPAAPARAPGAVSSGSFTSDGYQAAAGEPGEVGAPGHHGKEGPAGQNLGNLCRIGGSCGSCQTGGNQSCPGTCGPIVPPTSYGPLVGEAGRCGCGGLGGKGGHGGQGGGASVALLITGGATVVVQASALYGGDGGPGSAGGEGGNGGPGAAGIAGAQGYCVTGCHGECFGSCGCDQPTTAAGGGAGTPGGKGGKGATGGGGSGGPSHAVVVVASSFDDAGGSEFHVGNAGPGHDGAATGASDPILTVE